ncbi:hypothetical protein XENORESO_010618, partial [Xenotaenia resolanae]
SLTFSRLKDEANSNSTSYRAPNTTAYLSSISSIDSREPDPKTGKKQSSGVEEQRTGSVTGLLSGTRGHPEHQ